MPTLRIKHKVQNYDSWKKLFDTDPIGRKKSGVSHYRIYRPADGSSSVVIELDFDKMENLDTALQALQELWSNVQDTVITKPKTRVFDSIESKDI